MRQVYLWVGATEGGLWLNRKRTGWSGINGKFSTINSCLALIVHLRAYVHISVMFTTAGQSQGRSGARGGVERKWPFSATLHYWCVIGQVPISHQGPTSGVSPGRNKARIPAFVISIQHSSMSSSQRTYTRTWHKKH